MLVGLQGARNPASGGAERPGGRKGLPPNVLACPTGFNQILSSTVRISWKWASERRGTEMLTFSMSIANRQTATFLSLYYSYGMPYTKKNVHGVLCAA